MYLSARGHLLKYKGRRAFACGESARHLTGKDETGGKAAMPTRGHRLLPLSLKWIKNTRREIVRFWTEKKQWCCFWFLQIKRMTWFSGFLIHVVRDMSLKHVTFKKRIKIWKFLWHWTSVGSFESELKIQRHLRLLQPWLQCLYFCYWGALGPSPTAHISWVALEKTSCGVLAN